MSDRRANPSFLNQFVSIAVILGCFAVFGFLVILTNLPDRQDSFPLGIVTPVERAARLRDLRSDESYLANRYSWVDQDKGIVRLPIKRGMELTLKELSGEPSE